MAEVSQNNMIEQNKELVISKDPIAESYSKIN